QILWFYSMPWDDLSARNLLVESFRSNVEKDPDDVALVVPDLGYSNVARRIAEALQSPLVVMQKTHRDNSGRSEVVNVIGDIEKSRASIIDDEIDTAATILNTVRILQDRGVNEIYVGCTHAVLSGDAAEKLAGSGIERLITTDTVPLRPSARDTQKFEVMTVAPL